MQRLAIAFSMHSFGTLAIPPMLMGRTGDQGNEFSFQQTRKVSRVDGWAVMKF